MRIRDIFYKIRHQERNLNESIDRSINESRANGTLWEETEMGDISEVKSKISDRLASSIHRLENRKQLFRRAISAAAAILIFSSLSWIGFHYRYTIGDLVDPASIIIVKTGRNELKTIKLSDGSVVTLNALSVLSYPDRFAHDKREVELIEGEAFFDIEHNKSKPFRVKSGKTLTHVLGTAFNINAYSQLKTVCITVTRGKVGVSNHILLPDDQLIYEKSSGITSKKNISGLKVASWISGGVSFSDLDFKSVATLLENKYDVKIQFGSRKTSELRFTAQFDRGDGLSEILDALTLTRGLEYEIKGTRITISEPKM